MSYNPLLPFLAGEPMRQFRLLYRVERPGDKGQNLAELNVPREERHAGRQVWRLVEGDLTIACDLPVYIIALNG